MDKFFVNVAAEKIPYALGTEDGKKWHAAFGIRRYDFGSEMPSQEQVQERVNKSVERRGEEEMIKRLLVGQFGGYTPFALTSLLFKHDLTREDAATLLNVSVRAVQRWCVGLDNKNHRDMPLTQWVKLNQMIFDDDFHCIERSATAADRATQEIFPDVEWWSNQDCWVINSTENYSTLALAEARYTELDAQDKWADLAFKPKSSPALEHIKSNGQRVMAIEAAQMQAYFDRKHKKQMESVEGGMSELVICDLDGTLFDNSHRLPLIKGEVKNWAAYYAACDQDTLILQMKKILDEHHKQGHAIVFMTGGVESVRGKVEKNLEKAGVDYYQAIYMRQDGDFTPDHELKKRWLEKDIISKAVVVAAYDDLPHNIDMFKALGISAQLVKFIR